MSIRHCRRQHGVTLVEALMASVLLALAVVAVAQAVLAGQMQTEVGLHRRRGVELSEALLDEILRLPYEDPDGASTPGPEAGETSRALYDNLDDYHGHSEAAGSVADVADTVYAEPFQDFSRAVTVAYETVTVTGFGDALPGVRITVTTTDTGGQTWTLQRFVAQPPS